MARSIKKAEIKKNIIVDFFQKLSLLEGNGFELDNSKLSESKDGNNIGIVLEINLKKESAAVCQK